MALPIQVNPKDPFIDIHTGRGQGSCTFANGFDCVCSCAGIAHAQLLRMVLTPENSKKLPDKYKQALANKVQTVQARIADIPHDKVTTIIHAQKQPKRVFFLCEDVSHPIIDYCRVIDILRWARENPLASQQVSKLCTCVQNHGINLFKLLKFKRLKSSLEKTKSFGLKKYKLFLKAQLVRFFLIVSTSASLYATTTTISARFSNALFNALAICPSPNEKTMHYQYRAILPTRRHFIFKIAQHFIIVLF